jgi:glyoxylate carboligase
MTKMRAIDAAVRMLEKEGVTIAFGVPGAAINPLYSAPKRRDSIGHILPVGGLPSAGAARRRWLSHGQSSRAQRRVAGVWVAR